MDTKRLKRMLLADIKRLKKALLKALRKLPTNLSINFCEKKRKQLKKQGDELQRNRKQEKRNLVKDWKQVSMQEKDK